MTQAAQIVMPDTVLTSPKVVVIGGGPVGVRAAKTLSEQQFDVTLLSTEHFQPYNRVRLTPLLAGDVQFGEITVPLLSDADQNLKVHTGHRATGIDRDQKTVTTQNGQHWPYDTLIIATGSRAFVPSIPGHALPGVYTFRTAEDASALVARSISARRIVVIGGGLLGLEAARGMQRRQAHVTIVEHEARLMPRQLDVGAGERLAQQIETIGVSVHTGVAVRQITGSDRVQSISLADGRTLLCDTVIICTGVRANIELAQTAKLPFGRGIMVDDQMRTADPDIYAIGECAQHNDQVIGLVGPGFEQADVAVANILGGSTPYSSKAPATKLKVIGADVFSAGDIEQLEVMAGVESHVWEDGTNYRRVFVKQRRLLGAVAVGGWPQASKVQNAIQRETMVLPWTINRFLRSGDFWADADDPVSALPDAATICNCTGVTCGRLRSAMKDGANTPDALGAATGAGNVCGTCRPLLEELVNAGAPPKPVRFHTGLLSLSAVSMLIALALILVPRVPFPEGFDADSLRTWLWQDKIVRQWTGFLLLGTTVAAMVIGMRKRIRFLDRLGGYDWWRVAHLAIGGLAAVGLVAHTGLRPGANLNMWLFLAFSMTLVMGALAGLTTGADHTLRARRLSSARKPARRLPTWVHIAAIWPLPALILAHVLTSYAY